MPDFYVPFPTNVSMDAILKVWGKLVQCYYGQGPSASEQTTEIYAFDLVLIDSHWDNQHAISDAAMSAKLSLTGILRRFADDWNADIRVDGTPYREWFLSRQMFENRVYVYVERR